MKYQNIGKNDDLFIYLLLSLYPILGEYYFKSIPVSLADALLFLTVILTSAFGYQKIYIKKGFMYFGMALSIWNFVIGFQYGTFSNTMHNCMAILLFFGVLSVAIGNIYIDINQFYSVLRIMAVATTAFLIIQLVLHNVKGINIYGYMPFLKNNFSVDNEKVFLMIDYGRPTSFFYEPAHYCIYIAPILLLSLHFRDYLVSAVCSIGLLCSTSSTGYAIILVILAIYLFGLVQSKWKYVGVVILGLLSIIIINNSVLDLSKFTIKNMMSNIRIFKPFDYYKIFTFSDFILGIGHNKLEYWGLENGLKISNYSNSFLFFVMSFGIVGLIIMICFIKRILDKKYYWRPLSIVVIFLLLSDQLLFNRNFAFLLICMWFSKSIVNSGEVSNEPNDYYSGI